MSFRKRTIARIGAGAVGLLAAGAFATPAFAGGTADLEIKLEGTTIAAKSTGKDAMVSLINHSDVDATGILVTLDVSKLDLSKVTINESGCGAPTDGKILCGIAGDVIPAGADVDWDFHLTVKSGATGDAGSITATIEHEGTDPNPGNNSATAKITISDESGVDLGVWVPDVTSKNATPIEDSDTPLLPGDTTVVVGAVFNWGDMIAKGIKVTVQLPEHVTFAEVEKDCDYSADNRKAVCTYAGVVMNPTEEKSKYDDAALFWWPIQVSAGAPEGVTLRDGSWTVEALAQAAPGSQLTTMASSKLPKNAKMMSAEELGVNEVDASDNVDNFAVVLAKADGGGGGSLPVTGAEAGLIGGVGLAVVVVGGVMFLMARRRKVVLVTPEDEKPTA